MTTPSIPNTFSQNSRAKSILVNANFTAVLNALIDGTADLVIQSVTTKASFGGFASSATAQTLTADSPEFILLASPSGAINQDLPTTSVKRGKKFILMVTGATATNTVTLRSSGANNIAIFGGDGYCLVIALQDTPTTAAHWGLVSIHASGVYTPSFSLETNLDSVTNSLSSYVRNGKHVTVFGKISCDATTGGQVQFTMTLPVARTGNFSSDGEAAGNAGLTDGSSNTHKYGIVAVAADTKVRFAGDCNTANSVGIPYKFTYTLS